jgi:hypothetical protein
VLFPLHWPLSQQTKLFTKTGLGTFDNDAKSCYDHIIAPIALTASRALGMPEVACSIHGQTLDKMKHYIKTALGTSASYYSNDHEGPLFGSGQDSGGSPPLWLITWVALSNALSVMTGMSFCSSDHSNSTARNNDAFVDDTTGGVNDTHLSTPLSPTDLAARLQQLAQLWECLLFASGGRLELIKCIFYLIVWKWIDGEATMMSTEELNASIFLTCGSDPHPVLIAHKDVHISHKILGTQMKSPRHYDHRNQPAQGQSLHFHGSHRTLRGPSMKSKASLHQPLRVQPKILPTHHHFIPSSSKQYPKQTHPSDYWFTRRQQNVSTRCRPWSTHPRRTRTPTSTHHPRHLPDRTHNWPYPPERRQRQTSPRLPRHCTTHSRCLAPLLEHPSLSYPHLDSHQSFLAERNAKLIISCAWTPTLYRAKDRFIMKVADNKSTTTPIDRRHVNQCRKYLKIQRLSDLCNGAGIEFLPEALSYKYPGHNIESSLNWPRRGDPSERAWVTWKRILRRLFLADKVGPLRSMKLSIPLGPWMIDTLSADTSWPYYYDTNTNKAYERFLDGYWPMLRVRPCSRNLYIFSNDYTDTISLSLPPTTATPATLKTRTTN